MLSEPVLVDTGALIALYEVKDPAHETCKIQAAQLPVGKAYTCWPVITEASYLLRSFPQARSTLFQAVERGVFVLLPLDVGDVPRLREVFKTYHDQDVDLADACLVHLGNRENISAIFTLDRRHFGIFRRNNGAPFQILPEST